MSKSYVQLTTLLTLFLILAGMRCQNVTGPADSKVALLWKKDLMGETSSSFPSACITIDDDALYFTDIISLFYKIGTDGKGLKKLNIRNGSIRGTPVVSGNLVVVGTSTTGQTPGTASLYVLDKNTLDIVWTKHDFSWHPTATIDDRHIYCIDTYYVYAFDKGSGEMIWKTYIVGNGSAYNPVLDGDNLYFATGGFFKRDGFLYSVNKLNGEIAFQDTLPYMQSRSQFGGSFAGVEVWHDFVYVPADNRYLYCFNKTNGELVWKFLADSPMETPPRVSDGVVYTGSLNRTCYAIDAGSGELIWSYQTVGSIKRDPPQFYQNYVLFVSGAILVFDKGSGKLVRELTSRTGPYGYFSAVWHSDGRMFATGYETNSRKYYVFAFRLDD